MGKIMIYGGSAMYRFNINIPKQEHDAFVSQHALSNLLQSAAWASVKDNWKHEIVGVHDDEKLVASASILIKPLPLGFTMMYIPRGPIMDYQNKDLVVYFFQALRKWAKKKRCLFVKVDPGIVYKEFFLEDEQREVSEAAKTAIANLQAAGCIHSGFTTSLDATIQPRFHAAVKKCENYMDTLPKHTKRHIKTAQKKNISVAAYGVEKVDDFAHLMKLTEERKQISLRDGEYFKRLMEAYGAQAKLFLAQIDLKQLLADSMKRLEKLEHDIAKCKEGQEEKKENFLREKKVLEKDIENISAYRKNDGDQPYVAGALCVYFGHTCEMLYMGMDNKYQRFHGAYLSHIGPIQYAQEHDILWCNMGGLEGTLEGGLTKFKSNFHPTILEYVGEFDFPVNKILFKASQMAFKLRKKMH